MFDFNDYITNITAETRRDTNIANYLAKYPYIFPQLGLVGGINKTTRKNLENQTRLDVRWLDKHLIKRRIEPFKSVETWFLATIMFDGILPVGIIRATDNREDLYSDFLPIDKRQHTLAARYLFEFLEADPGPEREPYDNIGSFSGDLRPNFSSVNTRYYEPTSTVDVSRLEIILDYTETYSY